MDDRSHSPFTIKAALELASPPTWVAAVMPVLVGAVSALALSPMVSAVFDLRAIAVCVLMLLTSLLMQSAANSYNDYRDFKAGTDTRATIHDIRDASIIYNRIDKEDARVFAFALLGCAAVCGLVVAALSSWNLLPVGILAAAVVILYSAGPKPLSYLPLGEVVSGIMMGCLITVSTYYAITLVFTPLAVFMSVPPLLTIALIMLTNNTCDIERDYRAGRRTLPLLIGRLRSIQLAKALAWGTLVYMVAWTAALDVFIWRSIWLLATDAAFAVVLYLFFRRQLTLIGYGNYDLFNRKEMMHNITGFCRNANIAWLFICLLCYALGDVIGLG